MYEAFKKLRPGIPLKCLHGRMKQDKRMGIYASFCDQRSILFSTDVASRGLDFNKAVDWVVQVGLHHVPLYSVFVSFHEFKFYKSSTANLVHCNSSEL